MDGIALKPLTVSFVEPGFNSKLNSENQFGPWFMLSDKERQQLGNPMGPSNPQALNRYSYVQNNPVKYTDPSGHTVRLTQEQALNYASSLRQLASEFKNAATSTRTSRNVYAGLSFIGALLGATPLSLAIGALVVLSYEVLADFLDAVAGDMDALAQYITDIALANPDGVEITASCVGRLLSCDITIMGLNTGQGKFFQPNGGIAAKALWNKIFDVNSPTTPNGANPFEADSGLYSIDCNPNKNVAHCSFSRR
jgi:hypothetical protein